jgi:ChrR Cupin-like domain
MLKADRCSAPKETAMSAPARNIVHSDIKEDNPPERAAHYIDAPNMPWEKTKFPGIQIKVLEQRGGDAVAVGKEHSSPAPLCRCMSTPRWRQTYVIEGSLEDHEGKCGPGQFVWRPAGNQHEAVAPNGAILLGFFLKPNRFAYGEKFFTEAGER